MRIDDNGVAFPEAGPDVPRAAELVGALVTQARVIRALVLRETLTRYGEHKLGFLWALVEPLLIVAVFVGLMGSFRSGDSNGLSTELFLITGIVPFSMFRDPMGRMQGAITANKTLIGFPQVTTFDVIFARSVLECLILAFVFPFILMVAHVLGFEVDVENPLGVLAACLMLVMLGTGFGFLFAALTPIVPSTQQITAAVLGRPLFIASGVFYTADALPPGVRDILLYNPIMHLLELLRSSFFHEFETKHGDWNYALVWSLGSLAFGLLVHQALQRRATVGL